MPTYAAFAPPDGGQVASLLSTTPPSVTKALIQAYPFIRGANVLLGLFTWSLDDPWKSVLMVIVYALVVQYFEFLIMNIAHVILAILLAVYVFFSNGPKPELDSLSIIVGQLSQLSARYHLFMLPLSSLQLVRRDITRILFAAAFITPLYLGVAHYFLGLRAVCRYGGIYLLTYHSPVARATREILWRWKLVRLIVFYLTSINFNKSQLRGSAPAELAPSRVPSPANSEAGSKSVRFVYVLYENQRRWLGIGWTSNMLAYERAPWTDEFINEAVPPESFILPDTEGTGMQWRWLDKEWRLDLTCDGVLVTRSKATFTSDPGENDGFVYSDNMWKRPSAEQSFSKYTRRRRWVRTAELVTLGEQSLVKETATEPKPVADLQVEDITGSKSSAVESKDSTVRKRD